MSYVLDALKKADAERERGSVPGLYAQPVRGMAADASTARPMPGWAWALIGGGVVSVAVGAWLVLDRGADGAAEATQAQGRAPAQTQQQTPPAIVPTPAAGVIAATPSASPQGVATAQPAVPPPAVSPAPVAAISTAPTVAMSTAPTPTAPTARDVPPAPATQMPPARMAAPPAAAHVPSPAKPQTPSATGSPPPHSASHTANAPGNDPDGRILSLQELPPDLRRALPTLNVGGSVYSEHAPSRFVIINGQIYHENDKLTPELTLEQIRLKLAVLRYKDVRFRIMF